MAATARAVDQRALTARSFARRLMTSCGEPARRRRGIRCACRRPANGKQAADGYAARVDWYFHGQSQDGTVNPQGMIWLQHGFLANSGFYNVLATNLAAQTNSIVVVPTITSNPFACAHCWLGRDSMEQAAASLLVDDRSVLTDSAITAGYQGTLPQPYVVTGHSLGGGFAAAVAGYTIDNSPAQAQDGSNLLRGVVLLHGSHVDSMLGGNWLIDLSSQLVTKFSPPGNTQAVYTFADGWINDMYSGVPSSGLYPGPGEAVQLGRATAYGLPDPSAQLEPIRKLFNAIRSFIGSLFGG
jgi:hypothetical protein